MAQAPADAQTLDGLLVIGTRSGVVARKVLAIVPAKSLPVERAVRRAIEAGMCTDVTMNRRQRSIVVTDGGHLFVSAVSPAALLRRLSRANP